MSDQETCDNCRFWAGHDDGDGGDCRRNPPKAIENSRRGVWPVTVCSEWCGEYQKVIKTRTVDF